MSISASTFLLLERNPMKSHLLRTGCLAYITKKKNVVIGWGRKIV